MSKTNYPYQTSLLPYLEERIGQVNTIYHFIQTGCNCLLILSDVTGLPQSTVSGRVNDLISSGKVCYSGIVNYKNKNRNRKKIVAL